MSSALIAEALAAYGVPAEAIERECAAMSEVQYAVPAEAIAGAHGRHSARYLAWASSYANRDHNHLNHRTPPDKAGFACAQLRMPSAR